MLRFADAGPRKVFLKAQAPGFAAIVLAAGAGPDGESPCQLSVWRGRTLIEHAVRNALNAGANEIIVVVGDLASKIKRQLRHLPVRIVLNREWQEGISGSIRVGISSIQGNPQAAIVCLCDQPRVTSHHLRSLAKRVLATQGPTIAGSAYEGIVGAPAAFHRTEFPRLLALSGKQGARSLLRDSEAVLEVVEFACANESVVTTKYLDTPQRLPIRRFVSVCLDNSREARAPPKRIHTEFANR